MLPLFIACAGFREKLPEGPAVDAAERAQLFTGRPSPVTYEGLPQVPFPVLPVQVWGVAYDLDLVIVAKDPGYDMHEYARVQTARGPVWLAKDAIEGTLEQTVVADLPDLDTWLPELPVRRKSAPVVVEDRSQGDDLDLTLRYASLAGEQIEVHYQGKVPKDRMKKRNGSTMGHSKDAVLAVLDLPLRSFGKKASLTIDGVEQPLERLLGLVPFRMALVQTQGGLAVADLVQRAVPAPVPELREDGALQASGAEPEPQPLVFVTHHTLLSGAVAVRSWSVDDSGELVVARQQDDFRTLVYTFEDRKGAWELREARVEQVLREHPAMRIVFDPALPDLRRSFAGTATSRFVIDVEGQEGHATGTVEALWSDGAAVLRVLPEAPWWVADRPMQTRVELAADEARVRVTRVEGEQ